ncbi:MAG: hypothetical protein WBV82_03470 [Myxococcaceae bacterium]
MEWLEFSRWSEDVTRDVAARIEMQGDLERAKTQALTTTPDQKRAQLEALLRSHPASNPWGHPTELC